MDGTSFKERVKNAVIANASIYEEYFVKYEYLVCSEAYRNGFHIIKADRNNYLHLTGIHTTLTAEQFFEKCRAADENQLKETDFDFNKPGRNENAVKGVVRKKLQVLPRMENFFHQRLLTEEGFKKNNVDCAFATSDNFLTLGFVKEGRPKTLLKSNELDISRQQMVDFVFRKFRGDNAPYREMVYGDTRKIESCRKSIMELIDAEFFK